MDLWLTIYYIIGIPRIYKVISKKFIYAVGISEWATDMY